MEKIIIYNQTDMHILDAIDFIGAVIENGRVSTDANGQGYCFHTSFIVGGNEKKVHVSAKRNNQSDTFTVYQEGDGCGGSQG